VSGTRRGRREEGVRRGKRNATNSQRTSILEPETIRLTRPIFSASRASKNLPVSASSRARDWGRADVSLKSRNGAGERRAERRTNVVPYDLGHSLEGSDIGGKSNNNFLHDQVSVKKGTGERGRGTDELTRMENFESDEQTRISAAEIMSSPSPKQSP
jgi:hypothetical protein